MSGGVPESDYRIRLGTFLALDDVEFNVIALLQGLVSIQLNGRIVNEHIRTVIPSDESIAFCVVEPLDLPFVLSHWLLPSLHLPTCANARAKWGTRTCTQ